MVTMWKMNGSILKMEYQFWEYIQWMYKNMDNWTEEEWDTNCEGAPKDECKNWWDDNIGPHVKGDKDENHNAEAKLVRRMMIR